MARPRRHTGMATRQPAVPWGGAAVPLALLLTILLLAAANTRASAQPLAGAQTYASMIPSAPSTFWHFAIAGNVTELVWPALPTSGGATATSYAVQRWPTVAMPGPAQSEWAASLAATVPSDGREGGMYSAAADLGTAPSGSATGLFYRVVALASNGTALAASSPSTAFVHQGIIVSPPLRPCACPRLLGAATSLRDAIAIALVQPQNMAGTILVLPGTYSGPANTNLTINTQVTLEGAAGPGTPMPTIDCANSNSSSPAFVFTPGPGRAEIKGLRVMGGRSAGSGACATIIGATSPTISNSEFVNCSAVSGGALFITGRARPRIVGTRFISNYAARGGAIHVRAASTRIENCFFGQNTAADVVGVGGAILADMNSNVTIRGTNITTGKVGFSGGGIAAESSTVILERVSIRDNLSSSHAGGALLFDSTLTSDNSEFVNNTAAVFGGAILGQHAMYNATNTRHSRNSAGIGGGAVKLYSAAGYLRGCEVTGNFAPYGAGIEVAKIPGADPTMASSRPTSILVEDSLIAGNTVTGQGGGIFVDSADSVAFVNVTLSSNAAGLRGGGIFCNANISSLVQLTNSTVAQNKARNGGGLFASTQCRMLVTGSTVASNSAAEYGAGLAVADGASVTVVDTSFKQNGLMDCTSPLGGGGISVGMQDWQGGGGVSVGMQDSSPSMQCAAPATVQTASLLLQNVRLSQNSALDRGGGVLLAAGTLVMQDVELEGNQATGGDNLDGVGGGIALIERCPGSSCQVTASLARVNLTANSAAGAGGAVFYKGSSWGSSLLVRDSFFEHNEASTKLQGVGGGLYLGHTNYSVTRSTLANNSAFYGGALFLATDFGLPLYHLSQLRFINNTASGRGSAAFWLRERSPEYLPIFEDCFWNESSGLVLATEAVHLTYDNLSHLRPVQSNRPFPPFTVLVTDYYGNVATTENGTAILSSKESARYSAQLNALGAEESVRKGNATFNSMQLKGAINRTFELQISFERSLTHAAKFMPPLNLEPLRFVAIIAPCSPGSQPNTEGNDCTECSPGTFDLDGTDCRACPSGAVCRGGAHISTLKNFWRPANTSLNVYACITHGVCKESEAGADSACKKGHRGPLCEVCLDGHFKFGGTCRQCKSGGQAKAMLAVSVVLFVLMTVALFAWSWDFGPGPGVMTKVKIFITHFQMIALIRDYDLRWPSFANGSLSWFEFANVGFMMLAPECLFKSYNFYMLYIFQMALPIACLALCAAVHTAAQLALRRLDPDGALWGAGPQAGGWVGRMEGLKIRCWKNAFWFITLLYPRCAMTALQLFRFRSVEGYKYLQADFTVLVKGPEPSSISGWYMALLFPGVVMFTLFAVVIPLFWFVAVYRKRKELEDPVVLARYGFLYSSYSPALPYWETTEMLRKFSMAFIPVFIPGQVNGSLHGAVGQAVTVTFIMITMRLFPFATVADNWMQLASMTVLWLLLLSSGVYKWSDLVDGDEGSKALGIVQLCLSSGVGFVLGCAIVWSSIRLMRRIAPQLAMFAGFGLGSGWTSSSTDDSSSSSGSGNGSSGADGSSAAGSGGGGGGSVSPSIAATIAAFGKKKGGIGGDGEIPLRQAVRSSSLLMAGGGGLKSGLSSLKRGSSANSSTFLTAAGSLQRGSLLGGGGQEMEMELAMDIAAREEGLSAACEAGGGPGEEAEGEEDDGKMIPACLARATCTKPGSTDSARVTVVTVGSCPSGDQEGEQAGDEEGATGGYNNAQDDGDGGGTMRDSLFMRRDSLAGDEGAEGTPISTRCNPLFRSCSSMSRRSAADDLEMQLLTEEALMGVERSHSSCALLPTAPSLPLPTAGAGADGPGPALAGSPAPPASASLPGASSTAAALPQIPRTRSDLAGL